MSDESFELEAANAQAGDDAPSPGPRRSKRRAADAKGPATSLSWPQRIASPLVSPTSYYLIGFLLSVTVILALFNPVFGHLADFWPHEALGVGNLPFEWNGVTVRAITLLAVIAGYVLALLMRPGPARAVIVVTVTFLAFVTFQPAPAVLRYYVLPVALALVAGALIARVAPGKDRARKGVLIVGFALVAAHLFMPWDTTRVSEKQLRPGYYSTAIATLDYYRNPPESVLNPSGSEDASALDAYGNLFLLHAPGTVACLLFLVALAALLGLGGRWARWTAGVLMIGVFLSWALAHFLHGQSDQAFAHLASWQAGLRALSEHWHESSMAYSLALAGAVAELVRGRGEA